MSATGQRLETGEWLLLDGGNGQELDRRWRDTRPGLWGAQALFDAPETVIGVHRDFIDAGADVITTHTYTTTRRRLGDAFRDYSQRAVRLADQARERSGRAVALAGALPPLFGSYRPDRVSPADELEALYREQAQVLAPGVELLLAETLSTIAEGTAAARAAAALGCPIWVSWTVADDGSGRLRSGETVAAAIEAVDGLGVEAVLLNCAMPESMAAAVPELATHARGAYGAYANGFTAIPPGYDVADGENLPSARNDLDAARYAAWAQEWLKAGAGIIGGCCEVGPSHIQQLSHLRDQPS